MRYSSWDLEWDRMFCHFLPFLALSLPYQPGQSKFWKNENTIWRCHHFSLAHQKILAYSDMESDRQFFAILGHFLLFYPILTPKIKIWKIYIKHLEILYFLHMCTANGDLDVWLPIYKVQRTKIFVVEILSFYNCVPQTTIRYRNCYFSFCTIYSPFTCWQPKKSNFWKKWKKTKQKKTKKQKRSSFYISVPKTIIICYTVPEIWHAMDAIVIFHFGLFFSFYHRTAQKNENFTQMKKIPGDVIILHKCTKNHNQMLCCSWDMAHNRCNCYFSFCTIFCPFCLF